MTAAEAWLWLEPTEGVRQPHNVHYGLLVLCPMLTEYMAGKKRVGSNRMGQLTLGAPCGTVQGPA